MFNSEHLLVLVLGVGMLLLGGFVIFLLLHKKKSSCDKKCPPFSALNCPTCAYSNTEWMNINGLNDPDPYTNGYNDFCMTSTGSTLDWFNKVVPILRPLPKGTNGNDPKINGYNKFCGK